MVDFCHECTILIDDSIGKQNNFREYTQSLCVAAISSRHHTMGNKHLAIESNADANHTDALVIIYIVANVDNLHSFALYFYLLC